MSGVEASWNVCHARPRCEKKIAAVMAREGWEHYLPLVQSVRKYGTRTRRHLKPLFPGYVFAHVPEEHRLRAFQGDHIARLIRVENETLFLQQLGQVRRLVESGLELSVLPLLRKGTPVRVVAGALTGVVGIVEDPENPRGVVVSVDVLQRSVLVRIAPEHLQLG